MCTATIVTIAVVGAILGRKGLGLEQAPPPAVEAVTHEFCMRSEGDGRDYPVADGETLGEAMARENAIQWETVRVYAETTETTPIVTFHGDGSMTIRDPQEGEEHPGDAEGHCYNDSLPPDKVPPEGKTACACYQATKCDPKSSESHSCKRHCRKDKCDCCAI
jgi:hypothetical protein